MNCYQNNQHPFNATDFISNVENDIVHVFTNRFKYSHIKITKTIIEYFIMLLKERLINR